MPRHNMMGSFGRMLDDHESTRASAANTTNIAFHGLVVSNEDPEKLKRIKVRIDGIDEGFADNELPWCVSTLPDFFHHIPQVGECVFIMMMNPWNKSYARLYLGTLQLGDNYLKTMKAFGFQTLDGED